MFYEVLWYNEEECQNPNWMEFKTRKQAMEFYEKHKNDTDKFYFWVTKRNKEGEVVEDIIY